MLFLSLEGTLYKVQNIATKQNILDENKSKAKQPKLIYTNTINFVIQCLFIFVNHPCFITFI